MSELEILQKCMRQRDVAEERAEAAEAERDRLREVIRAALASQPNPVREAERELREALEFYADPMTYFAIGFSPDPPCGDFMKDWSEVYWEPACGMEAKPGKRARAALAKLQEHKDG